MEFATEKDTVDHAADGVFGSEFLLSGPRAPGGRGRLKPTALSVDVIFARIKALPWRGYSGPAIAQALALFGLEHLSPTKVRRRTSVDKVIGTTASTGWVSLHRWCDAVRDGRLFPEVRDCPASFTRRQVAERAASTMGGRAPPPVDASLVVRAFIGAARAA